MKTKDVSTCFSGFSMKTTWVEVLKKQLSKWSVSEAKKLAQQRSIRALTPWFKNKSWINVFLVSPTLPLYSGAVWLYPDVFFSEGGLISGCQICQPSTLQDSLPPSNLLQEFNLKLNVQVFTCLMQACLLNKKPGWFLLLMRAAKNPGVFPKTSKTLTWVYAVYNYSIGTICM